MTLHSRLALCVAGVALLSSGLAAAAEKTPAAPRRTASVTIQTPGPSGFDVETTPVDAFWTPLPSRYETGASAFDLMRVEWDRESRTWGAASGAWSGAPGAGIFGARLPSDRPVQVTRADGSVMLLLGPESMEFAFARLGPDGRFRWTCGPDTHGAAQIPAPLEDR